jgi:acyl-CoA synthetase (AMP-forming)/AMP-acid ligase II
MCENKRIISHSWFQYWMGHKGDMSARYSTEKLLRTGVVEEMRGKFNECCKYIETEQRGDDGTAQLKKVFRALALITGHSEEEVERPVAIYRTKTGKPAQDKTIRSYLADLASKGIIKEWWIPDRFIMAENMPMTSTGKIDKKALRITVDKQ